MTTPTQCYTQRYMCYDADSLRQILQDSNNNINMVYNMRYLPSEHYA